MERSPLLARWRQTTSLRPDELAFTFLEDGENPGPTLTRAALLARAEDLARRLAARYPPGERILLVLPAGLDFVVAFWGCLAAGLVAVPTYPPEGRRARERFADLARDPAPAAALSTRAWLEHAARLRPLAEDLAGLPVHALCDPSPAAELPAPGPAAPALIQYTSGSTRAPKGVVLTHAALAANLGMIQALIEERGGAIQHERLVSWLPAYHDMGLLSGVVAPAALGGTAVLLSPLHFLQQPRRWLAALTRFRGTVSAAPDFAYALAARKTDPGGLDLSGWTLALSGAEKVQPSTLEAFAARFAPAGFAPEALVPSYGLAEATVLATARKRGTGEGPMVLAFAPDPLAQGLAVLAPPDSPATRLVSCGTPRGPLQLRIVDPGADAPLPAGRIGEVWLSGPNLGSAYYGRPAESAATFGATLPGEPGPWLRTGDLGFTHGGELFLTGRIKDLVLVRGRNHDPEDLEATAREADPLGAEGRAAAFSVEHDEGERLVLVLEVERRTAPEALARLAIRVGAAVIEAHGLAVHEFVPVPRGTLPLTSSGKVQRARCRAAWLDGTLGPWTPRR